MCGGYESNRRVPELWAATAPPPSRRPSPERSGGSYFPSSPQQECEGVARHGRTYNAASERRRHMPNSRGPGSRVVPEIIRGCSTNHQPTEEFGSNCGETVVKVATVVNPGSGISAANNRVDEKNCSSGGKISRSDKNSSDGVHQIARAVAGILWSSLLTESWGISSAIR